MTDAARDERAQWWPALVVILAGTVVRLVTGALLPLVPDEAYYWTWSERLAPGYFDHPPLLALLIRAGTSILGDTPLGVRLLPILAGTVAALATAGIARELGGARAALIAAIAITVLPLAAAGLVLATPDAPLLAAFATALYAVVRAVRAPLRSRASLAWWSAAGVALGFAFLSKLTSILLPVGVLLAVATHQELRPRFGEPGPYVACVIATVVFFPFLVWNAQHDWISFGFQVDHGLGGTRANPWRTAWRNEGDHLGAQLGLASPILFILFAIAAWRELRARRSPERWLLATVSALVFVFFTFSATRRRVEPNWPAPAYVGAAALLAIHGWGASGTRWRRAGLALAGVLTGIVYLQAVHPILPLAPRRDPVARAFGWDALAAAVDSARGVAARPGADVWIGANRYQDASEIGFHLGVPVTFATNLRGRSNQYDLWPQFIERARTGDALVLALDPDDSMPAPATLLAPHFDRMSRSGVIELRRGDGVVTARRVYAFAGWRGSWPATP